MAGTSPFASHVLDVAQLELPAGEHHASKQPDGRSRLRQVAVGAVVDVLALDREALRRSKTTRRPPGPGALHRQLLAPRERSPVTCCGRAAEPQGRRASGRLLGDFATRKHALSARPSFGSHDLAGDDTARAVDEHRCPAPLDDVESEPLTFDPHPHLGVRPRALALQSVQGVELLRAEGGQLLGPFAGRQGSARRLGLCGRSGGGSGRRVRFGRGAPSEHHCAREKARCRRSKCHHPTVRGSALGRRHADQPGQAGGPR